MEDRGTKFPTGGFEPRKVRNPALSHALQRLRQLRFEARASSPQESTLGLRKTTDEEANQVRDRVVSELESLGATLR